MLSLRTYVLNRLTIIVLLDIYVTLCYLFCSNLLFKLKLLHEYIV